MGLRAGLRHKNYNSFLGQASKGSDAFKAVARLILHDLLGYKLSVYYSWAPDLQVVDEMFIELLIKI